ncbi:MAG: hypothetical protein AAF390_09945 [Pseudomonadota bacterium]
MKSLALVATILLAGPAGAQSLRNESGAPIALRAGPADWFPAVGALSPGQVAPRDRCGIDGTWCLTRVGGALGWVDTRALAAPAPIGPTGSITVTPLPPGPGEAAALPDAILDAVPPPVVPDPAPAPRRPEPVIPGTRPPLLLSVTAPVWNVTETPADLRAGPGTDWPVVGILRPGEGGVIEICDPSERWCRLALTGGGRAWVETVMVGLRPI